MFQKDGGLLFCEVDYKKRFVPRCAACSGFILSVSQPSVQLSSRAVNEASRSFTVPIEYGLLIKSVCKAL